MRFPRVHAPELMDQPGWPDEWRRMETDFLRTFNVLARSWTPVVDRVTDVLRRTGHRRIIDLCSGGGGLVLELRHQVERRLGEPVDLVLTDLHPNPGVLRHLPDTARVTYLPTPVDARSVPAELTGLRTICLGLHHLRPDDAAGVLRDAACSGQPIFVFEGTSRSIPVTLAMAGLPVAVGLVGALGRPRSLRRLALHTVLPVIPLAVAWDAVCSCLRSYEPDELEAMTRSPGAIDYVFEIGRERWLGVPITWVIGAP